MYNFDVDKRLLSLLKRKKVAIVGPGSYLTGKGEGAAIDEYDVVIRPNAFSIPPHLHVDYGSRTDVMFHNMGTPWMVGLEEQVKNNSDDFRSLRMVVCPAIKANHNEGNFMSWPNTHISACATNFDKVNKDKIPFWWAGISNYKKMYNEVGCEPYTGIMAVLTSSDCDPSELFLTGFDFYSGSKLYHDGYLASVDASQETRNKGGGHGSGCNNKNKGFIKKWINQAPFAKTDHHIRELLS